MMWRNRLVSLMLVALLVGCASAQKPTAGIAPEPLSQGQTPIQSRTLVLAHRHDPPTLAPKIAASSTANTTRIFNAALTLVDAQGSSRPYLAESVPQLNTDTWRVFPDG